MIRREDVEGIFSKEQAYLIYALVERIEELEHLHTFEPSWEARRKITE